MITPTVTVHVDHRDLHQELRHEAAWGLRQTPKQLSPKWFYDKRGSELFEQITLLPEYYTTRAENAISALHGHEIVQASRPHTFVELGAGASEKTNVLLDLGLTAGTLGPGDVRHVVADPAQAAKVLGFRAVVGLEEGLAELAGVPPTAAR